MTRLSLRRDGSSTREPNSGASTRVEPLTRAREACSSLWAAADWGCGKICFSCGTICDRVRHPSRLCPSLTLGRSATLTHDAVTAAASLADMVTDLLVLREFYANGLHGFFSASLCILILAQLSFAFLFTVEHTNSRHRTRAK